MCEEQISDARVRAMSISQMVQGSKKINQSIEGVTNGRGSKKININLQKV